MPDALLQTRPDATTADRAALVLMLDYVERECRRLGVTAAADHAARAAAFIIHASAPTAQPHTAPWH